MGNSATCCTSCESAKLDPGAQIVGTVGVLDERNSLEEDELPEEVKFHKAAFHGASQGSKDLQRSADSLQVADSDLPLAREETRMVCEPIPAELEKKDHGISFAQVTQLPMVSEEGASPPKESDCDNLKKFTMTLVKDGGKLGMFVCNLASEECVRVSSISPGGLVDKWNQLHPSKGLKRGDKILEVNGTQSPVEMRNLMRDAQQTILSICVLPI
mmetsp:Transcript_62660/g.149478  ORF Transcript_62660/g.149478 Transcript_62660/m.149478 type:complete len:215 (+) Transcript_62660:123-767(+)|eukprot:CAMPEP_0178416666 /NCGR_PEP_ID=MMETSP0689_2-20121128/24180_1 /TAXON_ID=160604 /ORGANISM="Amphidinium massartii, Strain CS-259" /LENGTH=214 /DNA_ID=CAMNT_0020038015 /DNA_START=69 /DNA_END=713 /DNA_ORIENTATION=+